MPMQRYKPEQIETVLRHVEVAVASGKSVPQASKEAEITGADVLSVAHGKLRNECLDGEIFYSLREVQIVIGLWREQYNTRKLWKHFAI